MDHLTPTDVKGISYIDKIKYIVHNNIALYFVGFKNWKYNLYWQMIGSAYLLYNGDVSVKW